MEGFSDFSCEKESRRFSVKLKLKGTGASTQRERERERRTDRRTGENIEEREESRKIVTLMTGCHQRTQNLRFGRPCHDPLLRKSWVWRWVREVPLRRRGGLGSCLSQSGAEV